MKTNTRKIQKETRDGCLKFNTYLLKTRLDTKSPKWKATSVQKCAYGSIPSNNNKNQASIK